MNKNEQGDIPDKLRRLRPVTAPPQFETRLHQKIRSLRSANRYLGWFARPLPAALIVAAVTLLVAAYFFSPYYVPTSSSFQVHDSLRLPSDSNMDPSDGSKPFGNPPTGVPVAADSLSADSTAAGKNDVNTSKIP